MFLHNHEVLGDSKLTRRQVKDFFESGEEKPYASNSKVFGKLAKFVSSADYESPLPKFQSLKIRKNVVDKKINDDKSSCNDLKKKRNSIHTQMSEELNKG